MDPSVLIILSSVCIAYHIRTITVGTLPGCRPNIVTGPKGSMIQPVNGWRARVALIVDPGTCYTSDEFM